MSGKKGTPKARVHVVFRNRLIQLRENCRVQGESLKQAEPRVWQVPADLKAVDLFDIPNLHEPSFNRTEINDNYVEAMKDPNAPGTGGDIISLKWQMDYVAAEERAFRARHASPVRNICHAMARRHFLDSGPTFDDVEAQAADAVAAGAR